MQKTIVPIIVWLGFDPFRPVQNHKQSQHKESTESLGRALQKVWEGPFLDPWDVVRLRSTGSSWNIPKKYGPHGELFFLLIKKEPVFLREMVDCGHSTLLEAEGIVRRVRFAHSGKVGACLLIQEDMWRYGCPNSPDFVSDVDLSATSTLGPRARNPAMGRLLLRSMRSTMSRTLSLEVAGQGWSGWLVYLFLEYWDLARVALSCRFGIRPCVKK